jgi:hypothetical protein
MRACSGLPLCVRSNDGLGACIATAVKDAENGGLWEQRLGDWGFDECKCARASRWHASPKLRLGAGEARQKRWTGTGIELERLKMPKWCADRRRTGSRLHP